MTPVDYLLTAFVSFMAIGCWILFTSARRSVEGYEDEFGFHFGIAPPLTSLYSALAQAAYLPAELVRAVVPPVSKRRRKAGSKPPMLPTNLQVDDLNPRPASKSQPHQSEKSKKAQSGLTQAPFPGNQPPAA